MLYQVELIERKLGCGFMELGAEDREGEQAACGQDDLRAPSAVPLPQAPLLRSVPSTVPTNSNGIDHRSAGVQEEGNPGTSRRGERREGEQESVEEEGAVVIGDQGAPLPDTLLVEPERSLALWKAPKP